MISVVIPIFNVELFLRKCLDSLSAQTYPEVEFILVDDGSTDNSGRIAEEYAAGDGRFRVFHTENHGLSCARNYGIDKSLGEWIMFVDSDDIVEPDFCRTPYAEAVKNEADLVIFQAFNKKKERTRKTACSPCLGIVDAETAVEYGYRTAWNKLYKKELFKNIRFPEGRLYEDIATTHKTMLAARRIVIIPDYLYYHVYRKGSITHTNSLKSKEDAFLSTLERAEELESCNFRKEIYEQSVLIRTLRLLTVLIPGNDPLYRKAEEAADSFTRFPSNLPIKTRIMLMLWKTNKGLFHFICRISGKKVAAGQDTEKMSDTAHEV